jgi:hypothetical protein
MKTINAILIASSIALSTAAVAEPFNDRGPDFIASVKSNPHSVPQSGTVVYGGFNDRGEDYISSISSASVRSASKPEEAYMASLGFNERDQAELN